MASIEEYKFGGEEFSFLNVSAPVGSRDAINHPDDVIVVQALLLYLPQHWRGVSDFDCPVVTGSFDKATANAIKEYQRNANRSNNKYRLVEDGRVSPANGKFAFGRSQYMWTILSLNNQAAGVALLNGRSGEMGYMHHMFEFLPQLKAAVKA